MKKLYKLLELVLEKLKNCKSRNKCICHRISELVGEGDIDYDEYLRLNKYIKKHIPINRYTLFVDKTFYWSDYKLKPRIRYLKRHIFWNKLLNR